MVTFYLAIVKFIFVLKLELSKPQRKHLISMVHGIILCAGRKNITQIRNAARQDCHLSSMTNFLNHSPWCVNRMQRRRMQFVIETLRKQRAKKGDTCTPVFFIIDDTSCKKDKSTKKMESLDFHYAHDEGKSVWSHCIVTSHIVSRESSYALDFRQYFREEYCKTHDIKFKSKNDLAIEMIQAYEADENESVYVLMDSWYTSKKLIDTCNSKGFHVIAAVRANRIICPKGISIPIDEFSTRFIHKSDLRSVTVENQGKFWVYEYEGSLSDMENVKLLLSWKNDYTPSSKPQACILCTDQSLDLVTIQRFYHVRWNIETGYRYFKELLGFDQYQLLSYVGIERFWAIQFLTYNYLEFQRNEWSKANGSMTLGDVVYRIRQEYFGQIIVNVYLQALEHKPLKEILTLLMINIA
jgi:SRSO17 transposase